MSEALVAAHVLEYPYTRSVGPVIGTFLAGLKDGVVLGVRTSDGRVICPPLEYDPLTAAPTQDFVEVGPTGVVTSWAWVRRPRANHPLDRAFAWALIVLDGADTAMLHAVDAGSEDAMRAGVRVRVRFREERSGHIKDIECFEVEP
jgi:uncharacterized OB-fold protein